MGYRERYADYKKKKTETESAGATSNLRSRYEHYKRYGKLDTSGVNQDYIDAFQKDASAFLDGASKNTLSFDSVSGTASDLDTRYATIRSWLYKNKNNLDKQSYTDFSGSLDSFKTNLDTLQSY